jgi:hypothetical protein
MSVDMTEAEWFGRTNPQKMLTFLRGRASDRKLRLFALACIRPFRFLVNAETRGALALAERFADGLATNDERKQARKRIFDPDRRVKASAADRRGLSKECVRWTLARRPYCAAFKAAECARELGVLGNSDRQADALEKTQCGWKTSDWTSVVREQVILQVNILHDLFDAQFRPMTFDANWRTAEVLDIALAIYDEHAFDRLPALADSLAAAGCDNEELLAHCRNGKPHYRGCWAVDLVLDKS